MIEAQKQEVLESWQDDIVQEYYINNAKKLYQTVDRTLLKYGGITDRDEFYVLATDLFLLCIKKFDRDKGNFDGFFYSVLSRKIITAIRDKNRAIRSNTKQVVGEDKKIHYEFNPDISISTPIGDGDSTIEDTLVGEKNIENNILSKDENYSLYENYDGYSEKMQEYLRRLSKVQLKVLEFMAKGYNANEIIELLHIDFNLYMDSVAAITSNRNVKKISKLIRRA